METEAGQQPKPERSRTRWTASLDKIFADLVVKQIQLGNRPNNVFDKKTWNHIRDEFNRQTDLNFNNNQLRKHLDVLRTRFHNLKSAYDQNNDFVINDSCCIGFDLWEDLGAPHKPETVKVKDCPIYEQLCAIFTDSAADGKYAQSSHYEELDKSVGTNATSLTSCPEDGVLHTENPSSVPKPLQWRTPTPDKVTKNPSDKKKKRPSETQTPSFLTSCPEGGVLHTENPSSVPKPLQWRTPTPDKVTKNPSDKKKKCPSETQTPSLDQDTCDAMAEALLEMVAASRVRAVASTVSDDKYSITNCIRALDAIEAIDQKLYLSAVDLFENPSLRETFLSLKSDQLRLAWIQGKCGKSSCS